MDKTKQVDFNDISPAGKRVMIAQDVINKLNNNQFVAEAQTWLSRLSLNDDLITARDVKEARQLKSIIGELMRPDDPSCQACALGGCFIAAVDLFNDIKANDVTASAIHGLWMDNMMSSYLNRFFDNNQLRLIEMAFEFSHGGFSVHSDEDRCAAAMYWNIKDPETRMISIMNNIIENKGQFVVPLSDSLLSLYKSEILDYNPEDVVEYDDCYDDEDDNE